MKLNTCSKVLFVLLITIIVLAIIIAVIYNCKRETFDLGKSIDHLVDGAIGSVSDTMDDLGDSDALIDIEYNNAPIYINTDGDLHAYEKDGSHHGVKITSGDAVSKQDHIPPSGRGSGGSRHGGGGGGSSGSGGGSSGSGSSGSGSSGSGGRSGNVGSRGRGGGRGRGGRGRGGRGRGGRGRGGGGGGGRGGGGGGNPQCIDCTDPNQNLDYKNAPNKCVCNSNLECKKCDNCTWCTGGVFGVCTPNTNLPPNCKKKPPSTKGNCYVGTDLNKKYKTSDLSGYNSQECDLHKNYQLCLDCAKKEKCGTPSVNGGVQCGNPNEEDNDGCLGHTYDKNNTVRNCLNPPDDTSLAGFGCPGLDYSSPSIAPIDPTKNNGSVCSNHPQ